MATEKSRAPIYRGAESPGRGPPRLQPWLGNDRPDRSRPGDGRGGRGVRVLPLPQVRGAKLGRREYSLGRGILSVAPAHDPEEDEWPPRSTASRPEQMPSKDMTMCS